MILNERQSNMADQWTNMRDRVYRSLARRYSCSRCSYVLMAGFDDCDVGTIAEKLGMQDDARVSTESLAWFRGMIDITGTVADEVTLLDKGEVLIWGWALFVDDDAATTARVTDEFATSAVVGSCEWLVGRFRIRIGLLALIRFILDEDWLSSSFIVDDGIEAITDSWNRSTRTAIVQHSDAKTKRTPFWTSVYQWEHSREHCTRKFTWSEIRALSCRSTRLSNSPESTATSQSSFTLDTAAAVTVSTIMLDASRVP